MSHLCGERPVDFESGLSINRRCHRPPQAQEGRTGGQCASLRSLSFTSQMNPIRLGSATMVLVIILIFQPLSTELWVTICKYLA